MRIGAAGLCGGLVALVAVVGSPYAEAQKAYSSANGQCSVHNACWQALKIPYSKSGPTGPNAGKLEACKAAGGPNAYFGRKVKGLTPCR
jgi:hypothetical protein